MKNRDNKKLRKKLFKALESGTLSSFIGEYVQPYYGYETGSGTEEGGLALLALWLDEEYVALNSPDWTKVKVDTPILVQNCKDGRWIHAHFAEYKNGYVCTWNDGLTSWVCKDKYKNEDIRTTSWNYAKLAEV